MQDLSKCVRCHMPSDSVGWISPPLVLMLGKHTLRSPFLALSGSLWNFPSGEKSSCYFSTLHLPPLGGKCSSFLSRVPVHQIGGPCQSAGASRGVSSILVSHVGRIHIFAKNIQALIKFHPIGHSFPKRSEGASPKTALSSNLAADLSLISSFQLYSSKSLRCPHRSSSPEQGGKGELAGWGWRAEAVGRHGKIRHPRDVG